MKKIFKSLIKIRYSENHEGATVEELKEWAREGNVLEVESNHPAYLNLTPADLD